MDECSHDDDDSMDDCDHEDNGIIDKDNDVIENRDGNNKCAYC